jgi:hypothetical protein
LGGLTLFTAVNKPQVAPVAAGSDYASQRWLKGFANWLPARGEFSELGRLPHRRQKRIGLEA